MFFKISDNIKSFIAWTLAIVWIVFNIDYLIDFWPSLGKGSDFNHYYTSAWLFLHGYNPYSIELTKSTIASQFVWTNGIHIATNPPSLIFFFTPFALASPDTSWAIWTVILVVSSVLSLLLILRELQWMGSYKVCGLSVFMLLGSAPFLDTVFYSNIQSFIVLLCLLGWIALRREKLFIAASLWGISAGLKFFTWPLLLFLFLQYGLFVSLFSLFVCGIVLIIPVLFYGPELYSNWIAYSLPTINMWVHESVLNYSFTGSISKIGLLFGIKVFDIPLIKTVALVTPQLLLIILLLTFFRNRVMKKRETDFSIAVVSSLSFLCSPVAWQSYLMILMFPMAVSWHYSRGHNTVSISLFAVWFILLTNLIRFSPDDSFLFLMIAYPLPLILILFLYVIIIFASRDTC